MNMVNSIGRTALCVLVAGLAACGGGGGIPGLGGLAGEAETVTLVVAFSYPDSTPSDVRAPIRVQPSITGLQGHAAVCTLTGGALPPGVTLDASSCVLSGSPTAAGRYVAYVTLTSPDVKGGVSAAGAFNIIDPTPTLVKAAGVGPSGPLSTDVSMRYAQASPPHALVDFDPYSYTAKPGDSAVYSISGALPGGVLFDPVHGTVEGTPTGWGVTTVQVGASLVRGGLSYPTLPLTITIGVATSSLRPAYPVVCQAAVATQVRCAPAFDFDDVVTGLTFSYAASGLPAGVTIDPSSGVISGILTTVGDVIASVAVRGTYPDGSFQDANPARVLLQSYRPRLDYEPSPANSGLVAGPGSNGLGAATAQLVPGAAFSINLTGIGGGIPGDAYTLSLEPLDANTPLPSWVSFDPTTGQIFGVAPSPTNTISGQWIVRLTTLRSGTSYVSNLPWLVVLIP
jgi:hypothetical protein